MPLAQPLWKWELNMTSSYAPFLSLGGRVLFLCVVSVLSHGCEGMVQAETAPRPQASPSSAVACAQKALGDPAAIGRIRSLRVSSEIRPPAREGILPATREFAFAFPDKYKSTSASVLASKDGSSDERRLMSVVGFNGRTLLTSMGVGNPTTKVTGDTAPAFIGAKHEFARNVLILLVRPTPAIADKLSVRGSHLGSEYGISVAGPDNFAATLLLDPSSCRPLALVFERPQNLADPRPAAKAGSSTTSFAFTKKLVQVRIELSEYRPFTGVLFPTLLKTSVDAQPVAEELITGVQVNPTLPANYFATILNR